MMHGPLNIQFFGYFFRAEYVYIPFLLFYSTSFYMLHLAYSGLKHIWRCMKISFNEMNPVITWSEAEHTLTS